jgi:phosphoribosylaminoimidazole (AIR) synthetase
MGLGMCLVMPAAAAERALGMISGSHLVGRVEAGAPGLAWEA